MVNLYLKSVIFYNHGKHKLPGLLVDWTYGLKCHPKHWKGARKLNPFFPRPHGETNPDHQHCSQVFQLKRPFGTDRNQHGISPQICFPSLGFFPAFGFLPHFDKTVDVKVPNLIKIIRLLQAQISSSTGSQCLGVLICSILPFTM